MWKILAAQIRKEIYYPLTSCRLFPDEQKGYHKGSRGTRKLFYIDQHILNESKTKRKNLSMAWIDYKKAYDMVPQSWIINCLKMFKLSNEVTNFIEKTMKTWKVELTAGQKSLAEAKVQGDALSPLLFIIEMTYRHQKIIKGTGVLGYKRTSQNTETSPGDLSKLAVTYSRERPSANADVKNSQEGVNDNNSWFCLLVIMSKISFRYQTDINTRLAKAWAPIDRLSVIWKSELTDKYKTQFFPSSGRVDTAICMYYMDANKTYG